MSIESLAPDSLIEQGNLRGPVDYIQGLPNSPDPAWMTARSRSLFTILRCGFQPPWGDLKTGAGLQKFNVLVRKTDSTPVPGNPTMLVRLYEDGSLLATLESSEVVSSTTGAVYSYTWDASLLSDIGGGDVQLFIKGTAA